MIRGAWGALALAACAPAPRAGSAPGSSIPLPQATVVVEPLGGIDRTEAARAALRAGLLSHHSTAVDRHRELAPRADGRGVLIAILDSGIDPSVRGLDSTSDNQRKIIDLRDFSGEGEILLHPATVRGDTIWVGERRLLGASHVLSAAPGAVWGGIVPEARYGSGPAADLNDNARATDTMVVVVAGTPGAWRLFADAALDRTLANDTPIRDYREAGEWFGWSALGPPPLGVAVNFTDRGSEPRLTLVFDNSGHGTHVAGIAAGRGLHGVDGFDGVAPGAQLLGYKIVNNAEGGITSTGSVMRAVEAAIAEAQRRAMPLVINLSFGIGSARASTPMLDALVDSVLRQHPSVVMTVAAANDGPGFSTLGVPASAEEVLSVGATQPLVFLGMAPDPSRLDPVAGFSSRGGVQAGPDLVAPGVAWSAVPRFDAGNEEKFGTSMAAPHVAGLAARLLSDLVSERRTWTRELLHRALFRTSRELPDNTALDQGHGVPDVVAAWRWLQGHRRVIQVRAEDGDNPGNSAVWRDEPGGDGTIRLRVRRTDANEAFRIRVRSSAPWLRVEGPPLRSVPPSGVSLYLAVDSAVAAKPGLHTGVVRIDDANDASSGPLAVVPVTLRVPLNGAVRASFAATIQAGAVERIAFAADTGRGILVRAAAVNDDGAALMSLHGPGGWPHRTVQAGASSSPAIARIDPDELVGGGWELVIQAPPTRGVAVRGEIVRSPFRVDAHWAGDSLRLTATSLVDVPRTARLRAHALGGRAVLRIGGTNAVATDTGLVVPSWAREAEIAVTLPDSEWARLTDFGVSVRDHEGRIVTAVPLNHARGRMRLVIPESMRGDTLRLRLSPAAVLDRPATAWMATVSVDFLLEEPVALVPELRAGAVVAPGAAVTRSIPVARWPVMVPPPLARIVRVTAIDDHDDEWTREFALPLGQGPRQ